MAHAVRSDGLIDGLITALAGISRKHDPHRFRSSKARAEQLLTRHNFGRTNQFDVRSQLEGLDEKLRIFNSDDLADALQARLEELSGASTKTAPETLAFLLQLSDQPAIKSRIEALDELKAEAPAPSVTWTDIIADDPLDEEGVWENVDFAADSSDGEGSDAAATHSIVAHETAPSSVSEENGLAEAKACIIPSEGPSIEDIQTAQFWNLQVITPLEHAEQSPAQPDSCRFPPITELQAVREVLFMLSGLPTSVYSEDVNGRMQLDEKFSWSHASRSSLGHVLESLASSGAKLNNLRRWTREERHSALMQTLSFAAEQRLKTFNSTVLSLQDRYVVSRVGVIVSLMEVHDVLQSSLRPMLLLSTMVDEASRNPTSSPGEFRYLESLFEATCESQMVGNHSDFEFLARLFFECFQTYAKPIRTWMQHGELEKEGEGFFIRQTQTNSSGDFGALWHDWYTLRYTSSGTLHAPRFIKAATDKIITTGKTVVFLKCLGGYEQPGTLSLAADFPLTFESVCPSRDDMLLASFSDAFDVAFDDWITSQHRSVSTVLRERMFSDCDLWGAIDAMEHIYFHKDGSLSGIIASTMIEKIDRGKEAWNDRFLLTELFQSGLGALDCVNDERVAVRTLSGAHGDLRDQRRSVKILGSFSVEYTLPWPISNVITMKSFASYQRIFTILLQIQRARATITRLRVRGDDSRSLAGASDLFFSLRQRLLWFSDTLYTYLAELVIASSMSSLRKNLTEASDMDDMISVHAAFIARLEHQCLLSERLSSVLQAVISLLDLSILFSDAYVLYIGERAFDTSNRSIFLDGTSAQASKHARRRQASNSSSSDEDTSTMNGGAHTSPPATPYIDRLAKMSSQFEHLCRLVEVSLRGLARAGGESPFEMLAERLEWGLNPERRWRRVG